MSRDQIVLMADQQVTAVPVVDCGEPLVRLAAGSIPTSRLKHTDDLAYLWLRAGVRDRLLAAAAASNLPAGVRLLFVEGWRPAALQRAYFDSYLEVLRAARPELGGPELDLLASRYISPPASAPHVAGAAVDLTLCDDAGVELDLGTPVNASPEESAGACYTASADIGAAAATNRRVLSMAMGSAGFVNYPTEWWHWSYGDRYWAMATGARAARYGPTEPAAPATTAGSG